jgi:hypothetical protein
MCILLSIGTLIVTSISAVISRINVPTLHPPFAKVPTRRRDKILAFDSTFSLPALSNYSNSDKNSPGLNIAFL